MDNKKIGQFLQQLRNDKKYTQQELADRLGVSNKTISKWETGRGCPDISMLESLSQILEVSIVEILNGNRQTRELDSDMVLKTSIDYSQKSLKENSKTRALILFILGLAIILFTSLYAPWIRSFITGTHMTTPIYTKNENKEIALQELEAFKTPYVGDNSKVGNLVAHLPMNDYGYSIEILSDEYGLNIYYHNVKWNIESLENNPLYVEQSILFNSLALFQSIGNLDHMNFYFTDISYHINKENFQSMFLSHDQETEYRSWLETNGKVEEKMTYYTIKENHNG